MKQRVIWLLGMVLVFLSLVSSAVPVQANVPERPIDSTVVDETYHLSQDTIATINAENQAWQTTPEQLQVGVYVTNSLSQDIESLANATFRKWQVGFAGTDNGILLVIAIEDREFRIETSDKASTVLTDVEAKRILESSRTFFREEDYNSGVLYIVDAIGDEFYGTDRAQARLDQFEEETSEEGEDYLFLAVIIVIILLVTNKGKGGRGGPGSWLWMASSGSSSRSSSRSFSSGGGGWSGGGGGGGGASSGW
ncbi:TPM domain-containing protein [Streptococcus oriscaviae]|uniref:TPM domain-containing protein n=1 Tax=Streptococcus oriscaviae TaxID=2781599 RepID=A0ABX7YMS5_9STRE|nr:TPM domain-containing protein [Streptococcus oriscaviae]QUE54737.1 TPM domain-containing protein [Streptococcus oriscaviae]